MTKYIGVVGVYYEHGYGPRWLWVGYLAVGVFEHFRLSAKRY